MANASRTCNLENAFAFMLVEINAGVEYPTAHEEACRIYQLTVKEGEQLTAQYDAAHN
jgi:hypothetical protein